MCTYLETVEATYYFRRMVPAELRPFILTASGKPRTEFKISLRTKDRDTAKRLLPDYVKDTDAAFDEARLMLAKQTAQEAAGEPARAQVAANLANARAATARLAEAQHKRRSDREPFRQELRALLNYSTAELHPRDAAIRDLMIAGGARMMADHAPAVEPRRGDAVPLLDLFDGYAAEAQIRATTAKDWRKVLAKLIDFLGYDDAVRITQKDLRAWRDTLLRLPNEKGQLRSPKTVSDTYLAAVRATLQWGVEQGKLPGNAANGVKVRIPKAVKLREREFTADEARRIIERAAGRVGPHSVNSRAVPLASPPQRRSPIRIAQLPTLRLDGCKSIPRPRADHLSLSLGDRCHDVHGQLIGFRHVGRDKLGPALL